MDGNTESDKQMAERYRGLNDDSSSQWEKTRLRKILLDKLHAGSYTELEEKIDTLLYGSPSTPAHAERSPPARHSGTEKAPVRTRRGFPPREYRIKGEVPYRHTDEPEIPDAAAGSQEGKENDLEVRLAQARERGDEAAVADLTRLIEARNNWYSPRKR
ncbi:MAG: hypothetical protein PHH00_02985 [Candidatus Nanoarchaeia archaeon]|nr:hypothetical protein [Candidatus Nanoarchaeia archaeon]